MTLVINDLYHPPPICQVSWQFKILGRGAPSPGAVRVGGARGGESRWVDCCVLCGEVHRGGLRVAIVEILLTGSLSVLGLALVHYLVGCPGMRWNVVRVTADDCTLS